MNHPTVGLPARLLFFALPLVVACGGDEGTSGLVDTTATAADTDTAVTDTAATTTTSVTDTSSEVDATPTCFRSSFHPGAEYFVINEVNDFVYGWQSYDRTDGSSITAILRKRGDVLPPTTPGTYTLGETEAERDLRTCKTCVSVVTECGTATGCRTFLATSGTLEVTTLSISGLTMAGRLTNVRLQEVNENGTPSASGRLWCLDELAFDSRPECAADADCAAREDAPHCRTDWRKCATCADDFDCTSATGPTCTVDRVDGTAGCRTLPDCNGADPGEPDDGPAAARLVTPGTPLEAFICDKDSADWYRFEVEGDTNVTPEITWQGQGYLYVRVYSEGGELLETLGLTDIVDGKNIIRGVVPALPTGVYYLAVALYPGTTFTVSYTASIKTEPGCAAHADCGDAWCVAGECVPKAECTLSLPTPALQRFLRYDENFFVWQGQTSFDFTGSFLTLTLGSFTRDVDPVPDVPGTYAFGEELNPRNCTRCMRALRCDAAGCKYYFAIAGALEVDTWNPDDSVFTGRLVDLTLVELGTVVAPQVRKVACAEEVTIDTRPVCETQDDCDGRMCLTTAGGTGACVDCREHADCAGGALDLCSPTTLGCVECVTSADCRTEPVCVAGTCAAIDECVGDDASEPLDDGKLGASALLLDAAVERWICGLAGTTSELESDWFSHAANGVGLRDFTVRWTGTGSLTAVLFDPNGIEVARETSKTGTTIVRRQITPGTWLLEVKTLDVPPDATIRYTVGVSRP